MVQAFELFMLLRRLSEDCLGDAPLNVVLGRSESVFVSPPDREDKQTLNGVHHSEGSDGRHNFHCILFYDAAENPADNGRLGKVDHDKGEERAVALFYPASAFGRVGHFEGPLDDRP